MQYQTELPESRFAQWVTGLSAASVLLALITVLMSLNGGLTDQAIFFGVAALAAAVAARTTAQFIRVHIKAATIVLVIALIAFASGLQSAILGTGL
jgi:hypothetical protein